MRLPKSNKNRRTGAIGEEFAAGILLSSGYQILARNFRTPYGEIDIIATNGTQLVFVEVKTRSNRHYGFPEDAITQTKQAHMISSADAYLQDQPGDWSDWRIDVISVDCSSDGSITGYEWFENAIS